MRLLASSTGEQHAMLPTYGIEFLPIIHCCSARCLHKCVSQRLVTFLTLFFASPLGSAVRTAYSVCCTSMLSSVHNKGDVALLCRMGCIASAWQDYICHHITAQYCLILFVPSGRSRVPPLERKQ